MSKLILRGKEARAKMLAGVETLAEVVTTTLGPKGRNVGIEKTFLEPEILHDGVSVAREVELEDPFENFAAQIVKQAASKTNDKAGDGTTTSTLLAYEMIREGFKRINAGTNPMELKKGMEKASEAAVEYIKSISKPVKTLEQMTQVATISSADPEVGKVIAEAIHQVGKNGVVSVNAGATSEIEVEIKEGMQFEKGYHSPYFVTNETRMEVEIAKPLFVLCDYPLVSIVDVFKLLEKITKTLKREDVVIIAPSFSEAVIANLILNVKQGTLKAVAVQAPFIGERQLQMLEDIAAITGSTVISKAKGMKIEDAETEFLGTAESFTCNDSSSQIVGGFGSPEIIQKRIDVIQKHIKKTKSDFEKMQLQERLAKLSSGAAIISVGAISEVEMKEKTERVRDAVEATKAAVEEGIVAGGGICTLKASNQLANKLADQSEDISIGYSLVKRALTKPIEKLLENSGADENLKTQLLTEIGVNQTEYPDYGFDVITEKHVKSLFESGIVDPTKVTINALQNATSVASMILTTEAIIVNKPEQPRNQA